MAEVDTRDELGRIRRVSDQLCTAHSALHLRYARSGLLLDLAVLFTSAWLIAMAFVDPSIAVRLTPPAIPSSIWIGLLSLVTFCASLFQLRTDWKGRSEAHKRSFDMYAEVKREAGYLLASSPDRIDAKDFQRLTSRYDMASDVGIGIPETEFLKQKQRHKIKVELSKLLDDKPAAIIPLERLKMLIRDLPARRHGKDESSQPD